MATLSEQPSSFSTRVRQVLCESAIARLAESGPQALSEVELVALVLESAGASVGA
jgi:DNA repair protein RadC